MKFKETEDVSHDIYGSLAAVYGWGGYKFVTCLGLVCSAASSREASRCNNLNW